MLEMCFLAPFGHANSRKLTLHEGCSVLAAGERRAQWETQRLVKCLPEGNPLRNRCETPSPAPRNTWRVPQATRRNLKPHAEFEACLLGDL